MEENEIPQPLRLNLGCGADVKDGYINIDIRPIRSGLPGEIVQMDVREVETNFSEVDEILALDILEHLPRKEARGILQSWVRTLRVGGRIVIRSPDTLKLIEVYQKGDMNFEEFVRRMYGGQDYSYNYHYTAFHGRLLEKWLRKMGMRVTRLSINVAHNFIIEAIKNGDMANGD